MSSKPTHINETVLNILVNEFSGHFTASEIRKRYRQIHQSATAKGTGQIVSRTISRLINKGFLTKSMIGDTFLLLKTEKFDERLLIGRKPRDNKSPSHSVSTVSEAEPLKELNQTQQQLQANLLSLQGQAEQFKEIFEIYPEVRHKLEDCYLNSKNQSFILKGKLRAIEISIAELAS